jgi:hypothetical protein
MSKDKVAPLIILSFALLSQILQLMRSDSALLSKEEGGSPIRNPSTAAEDARLASLISLDNILKKARVHLHTHWHCSFTFTYIN